VTALKDSVPTNVEEVRKLLGLVGYYRRYIPDFARTARPLFDLLQGLLTDQTKPANKGDKSKKTGLIPSSKPVVWQKQHENALKELLDHLVSPPIMGYPDHSGKLEFLALKWAVCEHFRDHHIFITPLISLCTLITTHLRMS
jgi:hypothetical protein